MLRATVLRISRFFAYYNLYNFILEFFVKSQNEECYSYTLLSQFRTSYTYPYMYMQSQDI